MNKEKINKIKATLKSYKNTHKQILKEIENLKDDKETLLNLNLAKEEVLRDIEEWKGILNLYEGLK